MPEGDTVHHAARRLGSALTGKTLTRTDFRVPRLATTDLSGSAVMGVAARGKHLLFRIVGGHTLHTHFKMDGDWHLYRPTQRWRGPDHEVRAVLYTQERVAVGLRLGIVEVLPTAAEDSIVGHLGPDPLGPDWDPDEAVRRIGADPERLVEDALLDQRVMAGPGNIYKCEVCFLRGVHPQTPVAAVADLPRLVALVHRLMEANRDTGRQITTGDTRRGMDRWVYGRGGRPCRRCGTTILKRSQGIGGRERVTYWCPSCQPSMT